MNPNLYYRGSGTLILFAIAGLLYLIYKFIGEKALFIVGWFLFIITISFFSYWFIRLIRLWLQSKNG